MKCKHFEWRKNHSYREPEDDTFCALHGWWLELGNAYCIDCDDFEQDENAPPDPHKPVREPHHGKEVWTEPCMDKMRRDYCLCLRCDDMDECPTAELLFTICNKRNIAMAVTRCPMWGGEGMNIWHGEVGKLHWEACFECEYGRPERDDEDFPLWNDGEYACRAPRELTFVLGWGDTCKCDQFREAK